MSVSVQIHVNENPRNHGQYCAGFVFDGIGDIKWFQFNVAPRIGELLVGFTFGEEFDKHCDVWQIVNVLHLENGLDTTTRIEVIPNIPKGYS